MAHVDQWGAERCPLIKTERHECDGEGHHDGKGRHRGLFYPRLTDQPTQNDRNSGPNRPDGSSNGNPSEKILGVNSFFESHFWNRLASVYRVREFGREEKVRLNSHLRKPNSQKFCDEEAQFRSDPRSLH